MISSSSLAVFLLCVGLLAGALVAARTGRRITALALVIAASVVIRVYAALEPGLHQWDERFHALVAKHLARHPLTPTLYDDPVLPYDNHDWMSNHIWLHKPPIALWLMAASMQFFGVNELAVRLPSVLLSAFGVALTYAIARELFDWRVGLMAAAFHSVNGFLVALASGDAPVDHVDTLLIVFAECGVLLALLHVKRGSQVSLLGLGVVLGLAVLTKWYPALLILPAVMFVLVSNKGWKDGAIATALVCVIALLVVGPWAWYIFRTYPREAMWEWRYGLRHVTEGVEGGERPPLILVWEMPKFFGELVYVPIGWALMKSLRHRVHALQLPSIWLTATYVIFSLAATRGSAYVMVAAPAVFIIEACFLNHLLESRPFGRRRMVGAVAIVLVACLPARYLLRPGGPFLRSRSDPEWLVEIKSLGRTIKAPQPVLFGTPRPIESMFYLSWPAYERVPTTEEARRLTERGYSLVMYKREAPGGIVRPTSSK